MMQFLKKNAKIVQVKPRVSKIAKYNAQLILTLSIATSTES